VSPLSPPAAPLLPRRRAALRCSSRPPRQRPSPTLYVPRAHFRQPRSSPATWRLAPPRVPANSDILPFPVSLFLLAPLSNVRPYFPNRRAQLQGPRYSSPANCPTPCRRGIHAVECRASTRPLDREHPRGNKPTSWLRQIRE
jgi:hypothetical protein